MREEIIFDIIECVFDDERWLFEKDMGAPISGQFCHFAAFGPLPRTLIPFSSSDFVRQDVRTKNNRKHL